MEQIFIFGGEFERFADFGGEVRETWM